VRKEAALTGYQPLVVPAEYRGTPIISKPFDPKELKVVLAQMLSLPNRTLPTDTRPTVH